MLFKKKSDDEILDDLEAQLLLEKDKTEKAERINEIKEQINDLKNKRKKKSSYKSVSTMKDYFKGISKNF